MYIISDNGDQLLTGLLESAETQGLNIITVLDARDKFREVDPTRKLASAALLIKPTSYQNKVIRAAAAMWIQEGLTEQLNAAIESMDDKELTAWVNLTDSNDERARVMTEIRQRAYQRGYQTNIPAGAPMNEMNRAAAEHGAIEFLLNN